MVAANSSGGVTGKMISPQSISVATAATGLVGEEGTIFRFTLKHSVAMVLVISRASPCSRPTGSEVDAAVSLQSLGATALGSNSGYSGRGARG